PPQPSQSPHWPRILGGYVDAAFRRAVKFGAGWYGFNRDPAGTKEMLVRLHAGFAKARRKRDKSSQILITPPMSMAVDAMQDYAEVGVDRVLVNLGSQRPEKVDDGMEHIEKLVEAVRSS